ncbi:MAG: Holliday junction branch migration protein RuvA [Candidatus Pacebacteria bacterium]|nr:Holliday junction branch migration protein RuvA [Candidatus Paceibacterota bacterium]
MMNSMISELTGKIVSKDPKKLVLDVHGVGYKIFISGDTFEKVKKMEPEPVRFFTHLAVREDALDLYGFLEEEGLNFFGLLISISGIGPKTAMGILSGATVSTLRQAIASGDSSLLTKMGGIGRKNADKIILELRDKIGLVEESEKTDFRGASDVLEALKSLGYPEREAREALKKIDKKIESTSEKVKHALKILATHA